MSVRAFVFVPARTTSTRLPGKALRPLGGKPIIQHLLERLRLSARTLGVVLCTTTNPADDQLERVAAEAGVHCFRGSETDLLARYCQAARQFQVELVINVDGDDILVDPEQVDEVVERFARTGADFLTFVGLPFGAAPIGVKADALEKVCATKTEADTATGWGRYFDRPGMFHIERIEVRDPQLRHPEFRLTLDYAEDWQVLEAIWTALDRGAPLRLHDVVAFLEQHPEIAATNAGLEARYWAHFKAPAPKFGPRSRGGTDRT